VELRAAKRRKRRAPLVAAAPRCAVSQNSILQLAGKGQWARAFGRSADYKSAIRQITNLRYDAALCAKHKLRRDGRQVKADDRRCAGLTQIA